MMFLFVAAFACARWLDGDKLSTAPVDNSPKGTIVEVCGPSLSCGSYTFFPEPLTLGQLCAKFYSRSWCASIPAEKRDGELTDGDAVKFYGRGLALRTGKMPGFRRVALGIPLNPNNDDASDLIAVPGIGPALAGKIIKHRNDNGGFRSVDELKEILGKRVDVSLYFKVENFKVENSNIEDSSQLGSK